jgi:hypothetical protein
VPRPPRPQPGERRRYASKASGNMSIEEWPTRWDAITRACELHSATGRGSAGQLNPPTFEIAAPATLDEVRRVESVLGVALPLSFRDALCKYSASVNVAWYFPENLEPPRPFHQIFAGECFWDINRLVDLQRAHRNWIEACFGDPDNPYDAVWHNKMAVAEVGNGDMIAIELGHSERQPVVYLSHDDGEGHGFWLGADFCDFIERHTQLGCPGLEDWQWLPFTSSATSYLDPFGRNAIAWQEWFGLVKSE